MQIWGRTLSGKTVAIDVEISSTVDELTTKAEDVEGAPRGSLVLVFGHRQLESGHVLGDYCIRSGSTVRISSRLRGGNLGGIGFYFPDVTRSTTETPFDDTAPRWLTACSGVNIMGVCRDSTCRAFDNCVIHMVEGSTFSICNDVALCPECGSSIRPDNAGFSDCSWMARFRRKMANGDWGAWEETPWTKVGETWNYFDPSTADRIMYVTLEFHSRG
mmetsp:Transcript_87267/g.244925  ORF Transcript_87267/g.244925 Transcript_87267/m.244925 type:complete len:217 (-) Transcript_87267:397-1047(-)